MRRRELITRAGAALIGSMGLGNSSDARTLAILTGAAPAFTYNWNPNVNLAHWRSQRQKVLAGTARGKLAICGDSTSIGWGAGSGGTAYTGARPLSWGNVLASKMAAGGLPTTTDSFFNGPGGSLTVALMPAYDARLSFGAGWTSSALVAGSSAWLGGGMLNNNTTSVLAFTPGVVFDTVKVFDFTTPSLTGTLKMSIDAGGVLLSQAQNPADSFRTSTVSVASGVHVVKIAAADTNRTYCNGIQVYDSTKTAVDVFEFGYGGARSSDLACTANAWSYLNALSAVAPDLTIIPIGINDWQNSVTTAAFKTSVQAVTTAAKLSGDVIFVTPIPTGNSASEDTQHTYISTLIDLSNSNNVLLIDIHDYFGNYVSTNGKSMMFDTLHSKAGGYAIEADIIGRILAAA